MKNPMGWAINRQRDSALGVDMGWATGLKRTSFECAGTAVAREAIDQLCALVEDSGELYLVQQPTQAIDQLGHRFQHVFPGKDIPVQTKTEGNWTKQN
jgi:hypothetical protein